MTAEQSLRFWDITTRPPAEKTCCAPNPWKARLALNFKAVRYGTTWTPMTDITRVRTSLAVPPVRKFADGSDFHTLPLLYDPATGDYVGDSFDIAVYLQKHYPNEGAGDLFPPQPTAALDFTVPPDAEILIPLTEARPGDFQDYAQFNVHVDAAFTLHVQLAMDGFPFDPATEEASKAVFTGRAGVRAWEDLLLTSEARVRTLASFERMLGGLAVLYRRDESGPFLLGTRACFADCIVGGWLRMMAATLPGNEWEALRSWHDGTFGRLHDALDAFSAVK
ncbi:uncharacterized protein F5Z01DRAFT_360957 [Emericellopsis atlantica]|uniref:GST N-terminal domain-containing protein n=1 Tax=Emericellopsis atlantica TaxID=2614577 RepID=A0A9P8CL38_9HYPO|nr:uncharacterized protein F5Z01DRAFT_360957 [Emericellopsis atlantica]KAG9250590.1 hypothetical protein F5Z01DRAFT_360957 [Emericellopsis atlantica]